MFSMQLVTRDKSLLVRRDISAHVEALHSEIIWER